MERYNTMSVGYFTASSAVIVCYSSVDHSSLRSAAAHIKEVIENVGPAGVRHASDVIAARAFTSAGSNRKEATPFLFLCGTKFDLVEDESVVTENGGKSSSSTPVSTRMGRLLASCCCFCWT
jgi:GTPase SAR1 family protein